jgi:hypothetical protein
MRLNESKYVACIQPLSFYIFLVNLTIFDNIFSLTIKVLILVLNISLNKSHHLLLIIPLLFSSLILLIFLLISRLVSSRGLLFPPFSLIYILLTSMLQYLMPLIFSILITCLLLLHLNYISSTNAHYLLRPKFF